MKLSSPEEFKEWLLASNLVTPHFAERLSRRVSRLFCPTFEPDRHDIRSLKALKLICGEALAIHAVVAGFTLSGIIQD